MMTYRTLLIGALLLNHGSLSAQTPVIDSYVETAQFFVPGQGSYVDVNYALIGPTLNFVTNTHGFSEAAAEVITIIERNDSIIDFRKTLVKSPERLDSLKPDLVHQERFSLGAGEHTLSVEIRDLNSPDDEPFRSKRPLTMGQVPTSIQFSDIELAEQIVRSEDGTLARSGYTVIPLVSTYYPAQLEKLSFYAELYNADKALGANEPFLITYSIRSFEQKAVIGNFKRHQRSTASAAIPLIAEFDIKGLPSGNYVLVLEALDREGSVLSIREKFFQRNNPISYDLQGMEGLVIAGTFADKIADPDTLLEYLSSLRPVADDLERKIIDDRNRDHDADLMKRFFYSFWYNRNSFEPEREWQEYLTEVIKVNKLYGSRIKKGYETDRGYVHLKFGPPNTITDRPNEMDAYPYQIWHYYKAGRYNNKRFIFYLPDLVTNDYELLHAEVPGEIMNPRWNQIIHSRNTPLNNVGVDPVNSRSGERTDEFFQMPR